MERRLAAILVADMAGYSRLMEQDEEGGRSKTTGVPFVVLLGAPANHQCESCRHIGPFQPRRQPIWATLVSGPGKTLTSPHGATVTMCYGTLAPL